MNNQRGSRNQKSLDPSSGSVSSSRSNKQSHRVYPYLATQLNRAPQQRDGYSTNPVNMTANQDPINLTSSAAQSDHRDYMPDPSLDAQPDQHDRAPQQLYSNSTNAWGAVGSHAEQGFANMTQRRQPVSDQSYTGLPSSQQGNFMHGTGAHSYSQLSRPDLDPNQWQASYTQTGLARDSPQPDVQIPGMPFGSASTLEAYSDQQPPECVLDEEYTPPQVYSNFAVDDPVYGGLNSPESSDTPFGSQIPLPSASHTQGPIDLRESGGPMASNQSQASMMTDRSVARHRTAGQTDVGGPSYVPVPISAGGVSARPPKSKPKSLDELWPAFWKSISEKLLSENGIQTEWSILPRDLFDKIPRQIEGDVEVELTTLAGGRESEDIRRRLDHMSGWGGAERRPRVTKKKTQNSKAGKTSSPPTLMRSASQTHQWKWLMTSRFAGDLDRYFNSEGTKVTVTLGKLTAVQLHNEKKTCDTVMHYRLRRQKEAERLREGGFMGEDYFSKVDREVRLLKDTNVKRVLWSNLNTIRWEADLENMQVGVDASVSLETKAAEYASYKEIVEEAMSRKATGST